MMVHFLMHLRLHYQLFILSGPYLLGGLYAPGIDWPLFVSQFFVVQILLFGGATAFNSFWDRDTGPVGGLRHPPPMAPWMRWGALGLQWAGLIFSVPMGWTYLGLYTVSLILFWLYSTPWARWKADPHLSLLAVGVSTGLNPFLLGHLAAGGALDGVLVLAGMGAGSMIVSMYPVSQVFQIEDDACRKDVTFAVAYGVGSVKRFFLVCYYLGLAIVCMTLARTRFYPGLLLAPLGSLAGLYTLNHLTRLRGSPSEYDVIMRVKYVTSLLFVLYIVTAFVFVT